MRQVNPYLYSPPAGGSDLFADPLDDGSIDALLWLRRNSDPNVQFNETTKLQVKTLGPGASGVNDALDSVPIFNATGRIMDFQRDSSLASLSAFWLCGLEVAASPSSNRFSWVTAPAAGNPGTIWGQIRVGGSNTNTTGINEAIPGPQPYLRMVHNAGTDVLSFYYSSDGITYTLLDTFGGLGAAMDITAVKAFIWVVGNEDATSDRDHRFWNLRVY